MNTSDIAEVLDITAKLMELHEENPFKIKALSSAAYKLSKTRIDLDNKSSEEIEKIEGVGKGIAAKITELLNTGTTSEFESLKNKTPIGVIEMMGVKGLGPKKVRQLWKELDVESVGELLYACYENRLVDLKGFGKKTQEGVRQNIEFKLSNAGKKHYASVENEVTVFIDGLKKQYPNALIEVTGDFRRKCEVMEKIEIVSDTDISVEISENKLSLPIELIISEPKQFYSKLFFTTATKTHLEKSGFNQLNKNDFTSEHDIYTALNLPYIEPELREGLFEIEAASKNRLPKLIEYTDLKGILHNHSTYSDGMNSLEEMAVYCKELGFEYFGICDHSQSAFYAGGLKSEKIMAQHDEINKLNKKLAPFKVFKGIESDILNDGSLDYEEDVLKSFDFIVASVHSNLKMDEEKANARLIKAIENPYTTILGHPTGRLLLARPGYPINHKKIIDACANNGVIIELNAHPYRLDIDWRWIPYCIEKGVRISINPDAHQREGLLDMKYGTLTARKGLLNKENCFNALSLNEIETYFNKRKK